jgi:hypothetical protein
MAPQTGLAQRDIQTVWVLFREYLGEDVIRHATVLPKFGES